MRDPRTAETQLAAFLLIPSLALSGIGLMGMLHHEAQAFMAASWAKLLFPFALLEVHRTDSVYGAAIWVLCAQFPAYAVCITLANLKEKAPQTAAVVAILHAAAFVVCSWMS